MIVHIDQLLRRSKPFLPEALVSGEALARVHAVAGLLPDVSGGFSFECRLEADAPRVDFMVCCMRSDGGHRALEVALASTRERLEGALWDGVRAFSREWADPGSPLARVPIFWIEYDLDRPSTEAPRPFPFACVQPQFDKRPPRSRRETGETLEECLCLTARSLEVLRGTPLPPAVARTVSRCFEHLPDAGEIEHVAPLAARGSEAVRLAIGVPRTELAEYLERIGWPGPRAQIEEIAGSWLAHLAFVDLNLDAGDGIAPTLGFALPFPEQPHDPWSRRVLTRLVELGLCTPEKRDAVLGWPGRERVVLEGYRWPLTLCRTIGVKLVCRPGEPLAAKAYPYFECRFSLWA